ncbi:hypothetical protein K4K60_000954 [Colletotrichum sp. SAR11_57]|nr:hypothetical protein K4K60_000954 [Colletotrichum sp. SAR11_57]
MTEPNRGWSWGDAEMEKRWESTLSNYRTVRKYNGKFQLLLHDLWGTDFTDESMEIVDNDMLPGLYIDIWNEPEWGFWKRPQAQWLHLFGRTTNRFRLVTFSNMRSAAGAPEKPIDINEYLNLADELNPATTVWHLSRFERYDTSGLRSNWRGGPDGSHLRDFLASLIWRDNENLPYHPNGDWQALKYYNLNMTGYRAGTTGSEDRIFDVYATVGNDKNLSAVGLPPAGELKIQTWGFTYEIPEAELDAPTDRGIATHSYTNDEITIAIYQTEENWNTAWAFEFLV